jgi:hypothetical protein
MLCAVSQPFDVAEGHVQRVSLGFQSILKEDVPTACTDQRHLNSKHITFACKSSKEKVRSAQANHRYTHQHLKTRPHMSTQVSMLAYLILLRSRSSKCTTLHSNRSRVLYLMKIVAALPDGPKSMTWLEQPFQVEDLPG